MVRRLVSLEICAIPAERPDMYQNRALGFLMLHFIPRAPQLLRRKPVASIEFITPVEILKSAIGTPLVELRLITDLPAAWYRILYPTALWKFQKPSRDICSGVENDACTVI